MQSDPAVKARLTGVIQVLRAPDYKLLSFRHLQRIISSEKAKGKKIVWTNGSFDLVHFGHVRFLKHAKSLGDILIVALNGDRLVREYKGRLHPVNLERNRAEVLSAVRVVDYVLILDDYVTPIRLLKPDIFLKGEDYAEKALPEEPVVKSYGGKVVVGHYTRGISTALIIGKIKRRFHPGKRTGVPLS